MTHRQKLPEKPGWAVGCPDVGVSFASTAFRLKAFQKEAQVCWNEFLNTLGAAPEGAFIDIEADDLRLRSLKEVADERLKQAAEKQATEKQATETRKSPSESGSDDGRHEAQPVETDSTADDESNEEPQEAPPSVTSDDQREGRRRRGRPRGGRARGTQATPRNPRDRPGASEASGGAKEANRDLARPSDSPEDQAASDGQVSEGGKEEGSQQPRDSAEEGDACEPRRSSRLNRGGGWKFRGNRRWQSRADNERAMLRDTLELTAAPVETGGMQEGREAEAEVTLTRKMRMKMKRKRWRTGVLSSNELEAERRKAFHEAAKGLLSVQAAVKVDREAFKAFQESMPAFTGQPREGEPPVPPSELVVRVEIREFDSMHAILQEFLVLGSQTLAALRDRIECPSDRNMRSVSLSVRRAFFYIEGAFYLDRRVRGGRNQYARPIIEFCEASDMAAPPEVPEDAAEALPRTRQAVKNGAGAVGRYRELDMCDVRWDEVGARVGPGASYVYCHQGCCEHLFVVKDVRLIHPDDPQHASAYPLLVQREQRALRTCDVCHAGVAAHVTYDDRLAPSDPCFWCTDCYRLMHYDQDGKLLYVHKVFAYTGG